MKKFFAVIIVCLMAITSWAYDAKVDGIFYNLDRENNTASVTFESTNYNSYNGDVAIPATITSDGTEYTVTSIGDYAFSACFDLTSIVIPNTITSIGTYSFFWCTGLTSLTIPSSVKSIGELAFNMCSSLASVHITDLTAWCNISFQDEVGSNPLYEGKPLYLNGVEIKDLVIPTDVTEILPYSFSGGTFTSVTFHDAVKSIGESAFEECYDLTSITIPESCDSVADYAFDGCLSVKELTLPSTFRTAGEGAFWTCYSLENIWCKAQTPPAMGVDEFSDSTYVSTKLHVPTGCSDAYKTADTWKNFSQISEYDYAAGINSVKKNDVGAACKYFDSGKVVIVRDGKKYSTSGEILK